MILISNLCPPSKDFAIAVSESSTFTISMLLLPKRSRTKFPSPPVSCHHGSQSFRSDSKALLFFLKFFLAPFADASFLQKRVKMERDEQLRWKAHGVTTIQWNEQITYLNIIRRSLLFLSHFDSTISFPQSIQPTAIVFQQTTFLCEI